MVTLSLLACREKSFLRAYGRLARNRDEMQAPRVLVKLGTVVIAEVRGGEHRVVRRGEWGIGTAECVESAIAFGQCH
jgi:hypothetical protein